MVHGVRLVCVCVHVHEFVGWGFGALDLGFWEVVGGTRMRVLGSWMFAALVRGFGRSFRVSVWGSSGSKPIQKRFMACSINPKS